MTQLTKAQVRQLLSALEDGAPHVSYGNPSILVKLGLLERVSLTLTPSGQRVATDLSKRPFRDLTGVVNVNIS